MNEKSVSYLEFEATQARSERKERRLLIATVIIVGLLFASNMVWLWAFIQEVIR